MKYRSAQLLSLLAMGLLAACDPKQDMGEQQKSRPMQSSTVFPDGTSARPLISGTIPRDASTVPGGPYASVRKPIEEGAYDIVSDREVIPQPVTADLLSRGQDRFNIYCSACHGALGNGNGMIAQRGFQHPPSYHVDRLKHIGDGHIFNVITQGYGAMYGYNDKIAPDDRWAIVAYVRALQAAPDVARVDDATRSALYGTGDIKASAARWRQ